MTNPLYDLIVRGESGVAGYNAYNRGTHRDAQGHDHMRGSAGPIDFSMMTLGQVQDRQHLPVNDENRLYAVGRYQITPPTMDEAAQKIHLDRNQLFTPQLQDRIFSEHLIVNKHPAVHDYIVGKPGATVEAAQHDLAREWASFGDPNNNGKSHYSAPNHASITMTQSADALNQMRQAYQANIAKGVSPGEAWRAVTAIDPQQQAQTQSSHSHSDLLKQGAHGPAVRELQQHLHDLGYTDAHGKPLPATGHFGPATHHALQTFQRDHNLVADGAAGSQTLNKLRELTGQQQRQAMPGQPAGQHPQPEPAASHTDAQPDKNNVRQAKQAFARFTPDPNLARLVDALYSGDEAAFSRVCAEIAQSPKAQALLQRGRDDLAAQQRAEQQQQQAMRQGRGRSLSR